MANVLAANSTNVIELTRLEDTVTHVLPTTAVVTCTIKDVNDVPLAGATDVPMPYEPATANAPAGYRARISSTVVLVPGKYTAYITAVAGSRSRVFAVKCVVEAD